MGGWVAGWVAGSIETKAISALKLELKLELAGAELGNKPIWKMTAYCNFQRASKNAPHLISQKLSFFGQNRTKTTQCKENSLGLNH